ncbi:hypothetical protein OG783_31165 [Streptomyces jietaisiensis]|uniref:beta/gamma crystallin domain-containing protein n=1 Tax=Streptomyces griseoaurantiacus TaxID=68213 RepID=UPI0032456A8C
MQRGVRKAVLAGLSAAALLTSMSVGASSASAISQVPCGPEFLKVHMHDANGNTFVNCYANAGQTAVAPGREAWVTKIETGNNMVQWYGVGKWQPAVPIDKWTVYIWPQYPDGVRIERVNITAWVNP